MAISIGACGGAGVDSAKWTADDLQAFFCTKGQTLSIIHKGAWDTWLGLKGGLEGNGLSIDEATLPDYKTLMPILTQLFTSTVKVEGGSPGITLVTVPKGLSLRKFIALFPDRFKEVEKTVLESYGDIEVEKTSLFAMTSKVFFMSRGMKPAEQKVFLQSEGCEMPRVLPAAIHYIFNPKYGDHEERDTYTRCSELIFDKYHVAVGGRGLEARIILTADGPSVCYAVQGSRQLVG